MQKKTKAIYFADPGGNIKEERDDIIAELLGLLPLKKIKIKATDIPPWKEKFDILFFDWGGLSLGNSMLEHFCRWIIKIAEDNPGRVFVMCSIMTEAAMKDALEEFGDKKPSNIYLDIKSAVTALSVFW